MYIKPINNMTCYMCNKKMDSSDIGYFSTYKEMFLMCLDCLDNASEGLVARLEHDFSKALEDKNGKNNNI